MALCLVPVERIDDAWMDIYADSPSADHRACSQLSDFKFYFIRTWLALPSLLDSAKKLERPA